MTKHLDKTQYLVVPDIETPIDKYLAERLEPIINWNTDTVVLGKLTRSFFVSYDYELKIVHIYTKYPEYLMTICPKLWENLETDINRYYDFTVSCHKVDSELLLIYDGSNN